jgi:multiple sugar transport system substrate-binding protein
VGREVAVVNVSDRSVPRRYSRREFLRASAGAAVVLPSAAAILAACTSGGGGNEGGKTTLNALFMQQAAYQTSDIQGMTASFEKANPNIKVNTTQVGYDALHDKIVAAAPAGTYDVVLIDVIWPPEFATKAEVVDVTDRFPSTWKSEIFPGALDTALYQDKYYGVPWILDTKYLFYNTDMLSKVGADPAPASWDEVASVAKDLKSKGIVDFPLVWSWAQAEAVICDYAQVLGAYGGQFLDASGKPAFNTDGGLAALEFMKKSIDDGLTNPASTESLEEDVRKIFSQGGAAMALNWTYMFAMANDPNESQIVGQVAVAHTPSGPGPSAPGCNGSMALSIAAGSKHTEEAWKYIEHITSQDVQDQFAAHSLPIWKSSYDKPEVVNTLPEVVAVAKTQLNDMILRPQVPSYNEASAALQLEIQNALTGAKTPQQALNDAAAAWEPLLQS